MNTTTAMSLVQLIVQMNADFNNPIGEPRNTIDMELVKREVKNVRSEMIEVEKAIALNDSKGVRDAFGDAFVFIVGAFYKLGFDIEDDVREIVRSLYTRFCENQDDVDKTRAKYEAQGVQVTFDGEFPRMVCRSAVDQFMGEDALPKGKFLKCWRYKTPNLTTYSDPDRNVFENPPVDGGNMKAIKEVSTEAAMQALGLDGPPAGERNFFGMQNAVKEMAKQREAAMSLEDRWNAYVKQKIEVINTDFASLLQEHRQSILDGDLEVVFLIRKKGAQQ